VSAVQRLAIINFILQTRRLTTVRAAALAINAMATLVAVVFLADGLPPLAQELRRERDAQANAAIQAFLTSLTQDDKARLYRVLSLAPTAASLHGGDAQDGAVLEKYRLFWEPFQSDRTQVKLWGHALLTVSSGTKAGEVWVALLVLVVVILSVVALRAHSLDGPR
jgi:hypothetical protein